MTLFLTSSPSGCPFDPGPEIPALDPRNHFLENLHAAWPLKPPRCLLLAAGPESYAGNDQMLEAFAASFRQAGLRFAGMTLCDRRNQDEIAALVASSGFIMLCGGHVPTQNRFFDQLGLPALLHPFDGIVLGVSAGTMNAARIVYAQPEEPGEAADPHYARWISGLGLTETSVWPHFQRSRHLSVDGQSLMDIALADSRRRPFYALPDGSYILGVDGYETLYGEGWYFSGGEARQVCEYGQSLVIR